MGSIDRGRLERLTERAHTAVFGAAVDELAG